MPASADTTEISWFLSVGVVPGKWDTSQYVMKKITEATGVTVTSTTPADDADTKLNLMIVNGDLPDIITFTNGTLIRDLIDAGLVWSVEEFFNAYLPESHFVSGGFPNDIKQSLIARDGGWYAIPSHILSQDNREIWGLNDATRELWLSTDYRENRGVIFNKTIMDDLGITEEDVQTESGVLAAFEKVKNANLTVDGASVYTLLANGKNFSGGWQSDGGTTGTLALFFGGMPVDSAGNYQSLYYSSQYKRGIEFLNICGQRGYLEPNQFTLDDAASEAACRTGRVFCFIGNTANTGFAYAGEWYTPGPILSDGGESPVLGVTTTVGRGWLQTFIAKDTKKPEAVARFLEYMSTEEGLMTWVYGEPGVDYVENEYGLLTATEEGRNHADNASVTGLGAFWAFANQNFDQRYMDPSNDGGIVPQCAFGTHEKTVVYNSTALELPSGYMEANPDMVAITTEILTYAQTELANIILQADENTFESRYQAMLDQLNTLGLPEVDAYINEAVQKNYETFGYRLQAIN
jgi:putative aldouronate transport system substrate-binding protein